MLRKTLAADTAQLQLIAAVTDLFPPEMLPDMIADFLQGEDQGDLWLTCESEDKPIGFCLRVPKHWQTGSGTCWRWPSCRNSRATVPVPH